MLALFLQLVLSRPPDLLTPPPEHTRVLRAGTGTKHPAEGDFVKLHYIEWSTGGNIITKALGAKTAIVDMDDMSLEWRNDILNMVVGEQRRTWVPRQDEVIDTELLDIMPRPETPPDVEAPPADAIVTPSGLAYKVLREGQGKVRPKPGDRVLFHYNEWTTDGKLYDSSILVGKPVEQPVNGSMPGFSEGVQLMTSGAKYRFWIPPKLAFAGIPDKPQGMVVVEVELFNTTGEVMPKRGTVPRKGGGMPPLPPLPPGVH